MPLGRGDVPEALRRELLKLWPVSASQVTPAEYQQVFQTVVDGRNQVILASMQAAARLKPVGSGESLPNRDPFQGGKVTITPIMLAESRSFQMQTVEEVQAAIGVDLKNATDNWAMAVENTRDLQCTDMLKGSDTGYDGKALFATDHPALSRYTSASATTYANTVATAASLTHATVRDLVTLMEDTNAVTEAGDKMNCKVTHLTVTKVSTLLELTPILGSSQRSGTANNDMNALSQLGITPLLWRNLDGSTEYLYGFSNMPGQGGLIYINKQAAVIETQRNFDTKELQASVHLQGAPAWTDFRRAARQALTAVTA